MTRVVHVNDRIPGAIYIGRAMPKEGCREGSSLANPFKIGRDGDRGQVIHSYRHWLARNLSVYSILGKALIAARGKPLACWCRHDGAELLERNTCHGDVIIEFLRRYSDDELLAMSQPTLPGAGE